MVYLNKIAISVIFVSILIGAAPFLTDNVLTEKESFEFDAEVTVVNSTINETKKVGLVTDSNMDFGKISPGMGVTKFVNITLPREGIVSLESSGNISDNLEYSEGGYFQGNKELSVKFNSTEPGYFSGSLEIKTQVAKNDLGEKWLDIKQQYF